MIKNPKNISVYVQYNKSTLKSIKPTSQLKLKCINSIATYIFHDKIM